MHFVVARIDAITAAALGELPDGARKGAGLVAWCTMSHSALEPAVVFLRDRVDEEDWIVGIWDGMVFPGATLEQIFPPFPDWLEGELHDGKLVLRRH